jgi:uncharacterized membrane protein
MAMPVAITAVIGALRIKRVARWMLRLRRAGPPLSVMIAGIVAGSLLLLALFAPQIAPSNPLDLATFNLADGGFFLAPTISAATCCQPFSMARGSRS